MLAVVVGFALGFVGSMPITGPVALLVFERGMSNRRSEALRIAVGAAVIEAAYAALAFWGIGTLLDRHPAIAPISRLLTGIVLLAIGAAFVLKRSTAIDPDAVAPARGGHSHSLLGASLILVNPTIVATWTVITTALHAEGIARASIVGALAFGSAVGAGIVTWFAALLRILHGLRKRVGRDSVHLVRRIAGWLILTLGLAMLARFVVTTVVG